MSDLVTYCDVYDCNDCPRMGDDCDGNFEEIVPLERVGKSRATPVKDCLYPKCEECDDYHGHYCTVPMVISKQIYRYAQEKMRSMEQRLDWLEKAVTDEILGEKEPPMSMANAGMCCENCKYYNLKDENGGDCKYHEQYVSPKMYCKGGVFKP